MAVNIMKQSGTDDALALLRARVLELAQKADTRYEITHGVFIIPARHTMRRQRLPPRVIAGVSFYGAVIRMQNAAVRLSYRNICH